jgi:hypothetical protein
MYTECKEIYLVCYNAWPPRSPDLTPLDFFLWGYMQSLLYETPVEPQHDLVARIAVAAGTIRKSFKEFSIT